MGRKFQKKTVNRQSATVAHQYYWIVGLTTLLVLFGLIIITSASQIVAYSKYNWTLYFLQRQALYAIVGAILFFIASKIDYDVWRKASWPLAVACTVLLVMVFIPSIGHRAGGSSRWIPLGFFNLQPSEFAKLAAVLFTVYLLDKKEDLNEVKDFLPFLVVVLMAALVIAQPDMGTALLISTTFLAMLFIAGLPWIYVSGISAFGVASSAALIVIAPYRFKRLISFIDPQKFSKQGGFQIIQSLVSIGSGGLSGVGLAMSKQKFFFLPAAHTDFIFAIIGEELGLIGSVLVVTAFVLLAVSGFSIAYNSKVGYARLLAAGLTVMITLQALVNMGAVVGLLPITGVPLPLISFGGSSLLVNMFALGIIASIASKNSRRLKRT